jgi:hypothetical protein
MIKRKKGSRVGCKVGSGAAIEPGRIEAARCTARYAAGKSAEGSAPRKAPEADGCKADCKVDCSLTRKLPLFAKGPFRPQSKAHF